jgi:WhiB family redox-sensing transcriptional regulator
MSVELPKLRFQEFDWMEQAECTGLEPELFFPEEDTAASGVYKDARKVCAGCPVQYDCLEFAVKNGIRDGMWGGRSPNERRGLVDSSGQRSLDIAELERSEQVILKYKALGLKDYMSQAAGELGITRLSASRRLLRLQALREMERRNDSKQ